MLCLLVANKNQLHQFRKVANRQLRRTVNPLSSGVVGSAPTFPTIYAFVVQLAEYLLGKQEVTSPSLVKSSICGISSAGRAPSLQVGGQGSESLIPYQKPSSSNVLPHPSWLWLGESKGRKRIQTLTWYYMPVQLAWYERWSEEPEVGDSTPPAGTKFRLG